MEENKTARYKSKKAEQVSVQI